MRQLRPTKAVSLIAPIVFMASGIDANAAESYRLRQSPLGATGGEIAATAADPPGFFGTVILTSAHIDRVADSNGNDIALPAQIVPLPTGSPTQGAIANGTYALTIPAGTIDFHQIQTQLNLQGGYLTERSYGDGRLAFSINLPLIKQARTFDVVQPAGAITPAVTAPPALRGAVTAIGTAANAQVQARVAAVAASHNAEVSGPGDAELSMVWLRRFDHLKVAAGVSVFVPTGEYDKTRGPNPGFGNFYTIRPGIALSYSLNPTPAPAWNSGVTLAARMAYGFNTTNRDTDYKSGNFIYAEMAVLKVIGNWAFGANMLKIAQVSDDTGTGAPADGARYRSSGFSPFLSYKFKDKEAGFNLQYSQNFGSRNALVPRALQLRFIKAW